MNNFKSENWETVSPEEVPERDILQPWRSIYVPALNEDGEILIVHYDFKLNAWANSSFHALFSKSIRCWLRKKV